MNIVKELRRKKGIQQKELALAIGVSCPTVSSWENNKKDPSGKSLKKLAEYFAVDELFVLGYGLEKPNVFVPDSTSDVSQTEQIVNYVLEKLNAPGTPEQNNTEIKTPEARLMAKAIDKMPKKQREQAVNIIKAVFTEYADYFEKGSDNDAT